MKLPCLANIILTKPAHGCSIIPYKNNCVMIKTIYLLPSLLLLTACNPSQPANPLSNKTDSTVQAIVHFSPQQTQMAEIACGTFSQQQVANQIICNGTLMLPPENQASISAPLGGFVKDFFADPGQYKRKGEILAVLQHPEYIRIQQEYLENKAQYEYYQQEFQRQGELALEQAASMKKMQSAQSDYKSIEAKLKGTEALLKLLNINPENLLKSGISPYIELRAPISGYVSEANGNLGKYIEPGQVLIEMVDKTHMHLNLKVFEKEISNIKLNDPIQFSLANNPGQTHNAFVEYIGEKVDEASRTITVLAHIKQVKQTFKPGMYVTAHILSGNRKVPCLPETALVNSNNQWAAFLCNDTLFTRIPVTTGTTQNGWVEILNYPDFPKNKQIVLKGAYYIDSELQKQLE